MSLTTPNTFLLIILTLALPLVSLANDAVHVVPPTEAKVIAVIPSETPRTDNIVRLKIISFNDVHGNYKEKNSIVGAAKFVSAINDCERQTPRDYPTALCILCAGDNSTGTALSYYSVFDRITGEETADNPLKKLWSETHVVAACIGNHEFDWSVKFVENHVANSTVVVNGKTFKAYSSSNVTNKKTNKPPGGIPSYDLIKLGDNATQSSLTIGVVTLTTAETLKTSSLIDIADYYNIEPPAKAAQRIMQTATGVDAFIFLAHVASYQSQNGDVRLTEVNDDTITDLVKLKPLAIVTAHSHQYVSGKIDDVPIIQGGCYSNGYATVSLLIDTKTKSVTTETQSVIRLLLQKEQLVPDPDMLEYVNKIAALTRYPQVGTNPTTLENNGKTFTPLGALISKSQSTAFRNVTKDEPVLAFQNSGGIRTNLAAGEITEEDCYTMLPFDTRLILCKITGKQIVRLIREGLANRKGVLQSYGLRLRLKEPTDDRTKFDTVTFVYRGKTITIEPETKYWVVLDSFIVGGGDYYSTDIFEGGIVSENGMYPREILSRYIREDLNGHVVINDDDCVQVK